MKALAALTATGLLVLVAGPAQPLHAQALSARPIGARTFPHATAKSTTKATAIGAEVLTGVVKKTCTGCHSQTRKLGNLVLEGFDVAQAAQNAELTEKMIGKLQAGMMPPPSSINGRLPAAMALSQATASS